MARANAPQVRVGGFHHDVGAIGPVLVEASQTPPEPSVTSASEGPRLMHPEVAIATDDVRLRMFSWTKCPQFVAELWR